MYTCPMHPEIKSEKPGRCPKCGMDLILEKTSRENTQKIQDDRGLGTLTWRSYLPLIVIISLILIGSIVLSLRDLEFQTFSIFQSIEYFMIGFFLIFAGFKLIDLKGFAEGYATYDLLAKRVIFYAYLYPFIELSFGLLMLYGLKGDGLWLSEVVVMGFSGIGVLIKIIRKEPVKCVCLGTVLKVPLTTVTIIEDFGMAILALILLLA